MFAVAATQLSTISVAALTVRPRNARHSRRAAVRVKAESDGEKKQPAMADELKAADAAWAEKNAAPVAAPAFKSARIDPADGSIAEAAPYGDDLSGLTNALVAFKEPRAIETINGRAAMIGWMLALNAEFTNNQSLFRQVINTRSFTLADGVEKSSTFPAGGAFLIPVTVLFVLAASLAPILRGNDESGLEKAPKDFFMFKASSEMTNGRGAMIGLASLLFVEKFTNGAALF
jgi:hypothetical protein